jgi:hypothetical protein
MRAPGEAAPKAGSKAGALKTSLEDLAILPITDEDYPLTTLRPIEAVSPVLAGGMRALADNQPARLSGVVS